MAEPWRDDFHTATGNKNGDAMRRALAKGLPVNGYVVGASKEYTPLHYAVYEAGGANVAAVPDAGVRADWWNPKWVPFAWDGQVILHQHAAEARSKASASFAALLQLLAEHFEEAATE